MTEIKEPFHLEAEKNPVVTLQKFWTKYNKPLSYVLTAIVLLVAGFVGYRYFVTAPNEKKAFESIFHAEDYYRADSARIALQGDNINAGFLKIMTKYKGNRAANLAAFYAGSCYLKLNDYNNSVKYLKEFSTPALQLQARAYGLLGDAYSELNKKDDAIEAY